MSETSAKLSARDVAGSTARLGDPFAEIERSSAPAPRGQAVARIAQRLLALTLGMLLNAMLGRAPRSLVAYDGR